MEKILILGEFSNGDISSSTRELITVAKKLNFNSDYNIELAFFQDSSQKPSFELPKGVVDRVILIVDPLLEGHYNSDLFSAAFFNLCIFSDPSLILFSKSDLGSNIGPRTAYKMNVPIVQGATEIRIPKNSNEFSIIRPVFGGNIMAEVQVGDVHPKMILMNEGSYEFETENLQNIQEQIFEPHLKTSMIKSRVVENVSMEVEGVPLSDAKIVVAGGRGLGDSEAFDSIRELAVLLNGAVGASRAACDAGWIDHSYQVGLTGQSVAPELYIAIGISGASQHMAGCAGSRNIVAINKDPDASIFLDARFGIVGDWKDVLPPLKDALQKLLK